MIKLEISYSEYELLKKAITYLSCNIQDADEFFDDNLSVMQIETLAEFIHDAENKESNCNKARNILKDKLNKIKNRGNK